MNKKYLILSALLLSAFLIVGCSQSPNADQALTDSLQQEDSSHNASMENQSKETQMDKSVRLDSAAEEGTSKGLEGHSFTVKQLNGKDVEGNYTVSFKDGNISAKFCNALGGSYTYEGDKIKGLAISTMMFCEGAEELMELENAFSRAVNNGATVNINEEGLVTLESEDIEIVLVPILQKDS